MVQVLAGLITYLLLAIYCREQHNEKVSIKRVRELRINIQNEIRMANCNEGEPCYEKNVNSSYYASFLPEITDSRHQSIVFSTTLA